MSDHITAEQAAILLADATPGPWEVAEVRDGAQGPGTQELTVCVNADPRSYQKPDGTWHSVFVCRGMDGPTREANAALLAAAPDLARTVILRESEVAALRDVLAQTERERDALAAKVARFLKSQRSAGAQEHWDALDALSSHPSVAPLLAAAARCEGVLR